MTFHEIEALSFAELKAAREPMTETAKQQPVDVLAARYVKALMDAKQRDEKLSEQGKTITALQDALEAAKAQVVVATRCADALEKERDSLAAILEQLQRSARETTKGMRQMIDHETARANRLKAEATRNHQAVAQAAKLLNDALAAQAVESADAG